MADILDVRKLGFNGQDLRHLMVFRNPPSSGAVSCVVVAFPDGHRHPLWVLSRTDTFGCVLLCLVRSIYLQL